MKFPAGLLICVFLTISLCLTQSAQAQPLADPIGQSVVRIETTSQTPDYRVPWNPGEIGEGIGTGFIVVAPHVAERCILTNAHVVSDARFINLSKEGDPRPFSARVLYIAHDCDLALLLPEDPSFFKDTVPLKLGGIPAIESTVTVYGYPLGGEKLSVTRGIVSRIDFQTYAHSGIDSHLTVQIDAAINPGNSGGPVIQNRSVVGVAFQGYGGNIAQNVGYMIPAPVISRFLQDIRSGKYKGYMDLAITYCPLYSSAMRHALGLPENDFGVMISTVYRGGSADGLLRPADVILAIDGRRVRNNGSVELDGNLLEMTEIIERKFQGDQVKLEILRDKKLMEVVIPLRERWPFQLQAYSYGQKPRYFIYGGLIFQPANQNFMTAHNPDNLRLNYYFDQFLYDNLYLDHPEIVVLSNILPDPINTHLSAFRYTIIDRVNGVKIRSLRDLADAFSKPADFDVIETIGTARPIVLERKAALAARSRIFNRYQVPKDCNL
ncbi:MAG: serine protease [Verrucomicrobia bacterium]|nr:MAG: serine protease [Verrucomicrobiota bacterium]